MKKKADRRVERTEQLLRDALFQLIEEKGFESLTVQEIIDGAMLETLKQRQREVLTRPLKLEERLLTFSQEVFSHTEKHIDHRILRSMASGIALGKDNAATRIKAYLHAQRSGLFRGWAVTLRNQLWDKTFPQGIVDRR